MLCIIVETNLQNERNGYRQISRLERTMVNSIQMSNILYIIKYLNPIYDVILLITIF
jgi:hypothetical protein